MRRLVVGGLLATVGCVHWHRLEFIVCPVEVRAQMEKEPDLGRRRELLFPLEYEVAFVERTDEGIAEVAVERAEHSTGSPRPVTVTLKQPTHVSDWFILHAPKRPVGVAIRRSGEVQYRVQWFSPQALADASRAGVVYLQATSELPTLEAR